MEAERPMFRCGSCEEPPGYMGERADLVYYFGRPPSPDDGAETGPRVHWFEMKRRGRGWSAIARHMEDGRIECPCLKTQPLSALRLDGCRTLSEMKRMTVGEENLLARVVIVFNHTIYQLVVSGMTTAERDRLEAELARHGQTGKTHDFCAQEWVDEIPLALYRRWTIK